ncbi:18697_t:CDS:2, partial [Gigaspora margarita]
SEDRKEERRLVINPSAIPDQSTSPTSSTMSLNPPMNIRTLVGNCTSPAYLLRDNAGQCGIYFIFQDLLVRTECTYTLKFLLCDVKELLSPSCDEFLKVCENVLAEVFSTPFKVHSAKKFPGMTESIALSKAFASQGIKLTICKDFRYKKINNVNNDELLDQTNEFATLSTPNSIVKLDNQEDGEEPSDTDSLNKKIKQERYIV